MRGLAARVWPGARPGAGFRAISFWVPLTLLGAYLYSRLLARFSGLPPDLVERSRDILEYRAAGEAVLRGEFPYRDFFIEYPPGSFLAFVPPALFTADAAGYASLFASGMALVLVATLALAALAARRIGGFWAWPVPALAFAAGAIMLYPVAVTRYDALVALTLAAATLCATLGDPLGGRHGYGRYGYVALAYASLGLGAAAKLVPALATLPLALLGRRDGRDAVRSAAWGFGVFFLVVALFFVPAYLAGGENFVKSFTYHADRGLQVESLAASVLIELGWISGIVYEYGAFDVRGRGVELLGSLSLPVTGALLLLTALFAYREHRAGRLGPAQFPRFAAALVLAFMLGSKVLSPQYMIWLLPLAPFAAGGLAGAGVSAIFLAACWTTTQVFPLHYGDLLRFRPAGTDLLLSRNLLLAVLWALMLFLPADEAPGRSKP